MKSVIVRNCTRIEKGTGGTSKEWVRITTPANRPISFEELYYICRWIGECEDSKYSEPHHKGKRMVINFLIAAVGGPKTYMELAKEFKLPEATSRSK